MKIRSIVASATALLLCTFAFAGPEDMTVQTWAGDCTHTMTTNHFELAPGDKVEIDISMLGCGEAAMGGALYFGYLTTKNSSKPLNSRSNIRLTLVDDVTGESFSSDSGSIFTQVDNPTSCKLFAENVDRRKSKKIRLRFSSGL